MTNKADDIEWGPWFLGNGRPPYKYKSEPVRGGRGVSFSDNLQAVKLRDILWRNDTPYQLHADHPHYTLEGQLYYLKQQFPDVAWVQALEAPEAPEPVDPVLLKAREIYMRRHYSFRPDVCDGSWDHTHEMKLIIKGIKAGMDMAK